MTCTLEAALAKLSILDEAKLTQVLRKFIR